MEKQPNSRSHPVLRWGALALGTVIWGSGVAAMYGDDYKVAVALYLVGIIIVAVDFITLEGHSEYRGSKRLILVGCTTFVAALAFALSLAWIHLRKADIQAVQVAPQSEQPQAESPAPAPTHTQSSKEPSFVYVVPGVWLNNSTWDLIVRHHGPNPVNNIEIVFDDQDRHKQVAPTGKLFNVNDIIKTLHFDEIDAVEGVLAKQFLWTPLNPDSSTFSVAVASRQGRVDEMLKIVGHDGKDWQFAIKVSDSKNVLLHCRDPKFPVSVEFPERLPRCFPDYTVGPAKSAPKTAEHAAARTSGANSPAVGSIQQGPGSALSIGQQGGITAGTINIGTLPPKPLVLTEEQSSHIRSDMAKYSGIAIEIVLVNRNRGTEEFGNHLVSALKDAGWDVIYSSAAILIRSNGTQSSPGLSLDIGPGSDNVASELGLSLMRHGVIDNKPIPAMRVPESNKLALYICEPK